MFATIGAPIRPDGKLISVPAVHTIEGEPANPGWTKRH
jgi:hypothetical protein